MYHTSAFIRFVYIYTRQSLDNDHLVCDELDLRHTKILHLFTNVFLPFFLVRWWRYLITLIMASTLPALKLLVKRYNYQIFSFSFSSHAQSDFEVYSFSSRYFDYISLHVIKLFFWVVKIFLHIIMISLVKSVEMIIFSMLLKRALNFILKLMESKCEVP